MELSARFKASVGWALRCKAPLAMAILVVPAVLLRFSIRGTGEAGLYWLPAGAALVVAGLAIRALAAGTDTSLLDWRPARLADVLILAGIAVTLASWWILAVTLALSAMVYGPILFIRSRSSRHVFWHLWSWRIWIRRERIVICGVFMAFAAAFCFRGYILAGEITRGMGWFVVTIAAVSFWLASGLVSGRPVSPASRRASADRSPPGMAAMASWLVVAGLIVLAWEAGRFLCRPHHFGVVDKGVLYRSGQPANFEQWRWIHDRYGIRTVIDLRARRPAAPWSVMEERFCRENGIRRIKLPIGPRRLTDAELGVIVRRVTDPRRQPVLVHCEAGSSRTGVAVAAYRIVIAGWSVESALRESRKYKRRMNPNYAAYLAGLFRWRKALSSNKGRYLNCRLARDILVAYRMKGSR